ncbi:MAG TPA: hypothetical protein VGH48_16250 [Caldimonas sp.]
MHTFAQRPKRAPQTVSAAPATTQRTIGNRALQRTREADAEAADSATPRVARFAPDFSGIPAVAPDRATGNAAGDGGSGVRPVVRRQRHQLSAAIRRVDPVAAHDSVGRVETVRFSALPAIHVPARFDAIGTTLTYDPSINPIRPPATPAKFGQTDTWIEVNKSSGRPENGKFLVELVVENLITFWVAGSVAGATRANIASAGDANITQANYPTVVSDLTPSPRPVHTGSLDLMKNQPPRSHFWAEDLTIKHERFHANENEKFGREGALAGRDWLDTQTAQNLDQVEALVGRVAPLVAQRIAVGMAPPGVEQRAYDDGAADYAARAAAIKAKGDANGYGQHP